MWFLLIVFVYSLVIHHDYILPCLLHPLLLLLLVLIACCSLRSDAQEEEHTTAFFEDQSNTREKFTEYLQHLRQRGPLVQWSIDPLPLYQWWQPMGCPGETDHAKPLSTCFWRPEFQKLSGRWCSWEVEFTRTNLSKKTWQLTMNCLDHRQPDWITGSRIGSPNDEAASAISTYMHPIRVVMVMMHVNWRPISFHINTPGLYLPAGDTC